jgi:hypothetical protein
MDCSVRVRHAVLSDPLWGRTLDLDLDLDLEPEPEAVAPARVR